MPAKADRIEDLYIAEKGNVSSMAEKKIGEIKEELKAVDDEKLPSFIETYEKDERSGVVKIVEQAKKRIEKLEAEKLRIENLKKYEREYADCGYICGIDEVGRGPLAGPVVAGAVILPKDCDILYINDSKKLSAAKREELYDVIMEKAVAVGIGMASSQRIDEINILQATYEAMREAISKLSVKPDILLNDAVTIPGVSILSLIHIYRTVIMLCETFTNYFCISSVSLNSSFTALLKHRSWSKYHTVNIMFC